MFDSRSLCVYSFILLLCERYLKEITSENAFAHRFPSPDQHTSVTTIRLFDNSSQVRYPIRHVRYFIHKQFQTPLLFIQKHLVIWPRLACKLACQQTKALLKEFPGLFALKSLAQVILRMIE